MVYFIYTLIVNHRIYRHKRIPRVRCRFMLSKLSTDEPVGRIVFWKTDGSIKEWRI